jgi:myosin heavy subunit
LKTANNFDSQLTLRQLRYAGLFEAIRIRKSGYSYRASFKMFGNTYATLVTGLMKKKEKKLINELDICKEICNKIEKDNIINIKNWKIGKTKVFVKNNSDVMLLDRAKALRTTNYVVKIQAMVRFFLSNIKIYQMRMEVIKQKKIREELLKKQLANVGVARRNCVMLKNRIININIYSICS